MTNAIVNYKLSNLDAIDLLPPQDKQVIQMRLGIGKYDRQYTLKEISSILGYPFSERARQIEGRALRKLRHPASNCLVLQKGYDFE